MAYKMKPVTPNIKVVDKVIESIRNSEIFTTSRETSRVDESSEPFPSGIIAWVNYVTGHRFLTDFEHARKSLGLKNYHQFNLLYVPPGWVVDKYTKEDAIEMLENFKKTGVIEWPDKYGKRKK